MTGGHGRDWREHWRTVQRTPSDDPAEALSQVGKTMLGEPVAAETIEAISSRIIDVLGIGSADVVWDLGCGNGLLTERVARTGCEIDGFDVSPNLVADARRHRGGPNIRYTVADLAEPGFLDGRPPAAKAYSYEVVQHLDTVEWGRLLAYLGDAAPGIRIFVGSIPDAGRIRNFYDTVERWERYLRKVADGTEQIGTWWMRDDFVAAAANRGFECEILPQPPELYTSHYRFDALLWA